MPRVVVLAVKLPQPGAANLEPAAYRRLVPEDTVLDLVRLAGVVEHKTLVILRTVVHHSGERVIVGENSEKTFIQILSVLPNVVSKHKDIVHVRPNHRRHVHNVLTGHHEKELPVAAIHEALSDAVVAHKGPVVHAVVE